MSGVVTNCVRSFAAPTILEHFRVALPMQLFTAEVYMVKSFRDLQVWQKAMELADTVYTLTAEFPRSEMFGLASQMRRAAVSIPSNIAEGRAAGGGRFLSHIRIALGSDAELQTQIELAIRRSYIGAGPGHNLLEQAAEVARMLHAMHYTLKTRQTRARTLGATAIFLILHAGGVFYG